MKLQKSTELRDMEIDEVSIVDAPANKRKFLFYKGANTMDILRMTDDDIAKLDEEKQKAVKVLKQYSEVMPEEMSTAISALLKDDEPPAEEAQEKEETTGLSDEERKELEGVRDRINAILEPQSEEEKKEAEVQKRWAKVDKIVSMLEKSMTGESEEKGKKESPVDDILKRLAAIEKHTTQKQGLEDDKLEKGDDKDPFPSIPA